jgi:hypothetical protein
MEEKKNSKSSFWSWKLDTEELESQVANYGSLKITQSYRGISVLIFIVLLGFSFVLSFLGLYATPEIMLYSLVVYAPVLFFFYRGYRWAIISLILLWTLEKGSAVYESNGQGFLIQFLWWLGVMSYMVKALKVENTRRANKKAITDSSLGKKFCMHCGGSVEIDSKFCTQCGKSVVVKS